MPVTPPLSGALRAKGLLFDLDGTIIDSTHLFEAVWTRWAEANGIDPAAILAIHHGRKIPDTIREVTPAGFDIEQGEREVLAMAVAGFEGLRPVPGIGALLKSLPPGSWGIVTSSYAEIVRGWLGHFGLPQPAVVVTARDVTRGKPDPEGYRLGAGRLGVAPEECIVFEDAPAGIAAGRAAGCTVVTIATMLAGEALEGHRWVPDFTALSVEITTDGLILSSSA